MSKLLEAKRKSLAKTDRYSTLNCRYFTTLMENIVKDQKEMNGHFVNEGIFFDDIVDYPVTCDEFNIFKDRVNATQEETRIALEVEHSRGVVNHIYTSVDLDKNLVTYKLGFATEW